MFKFNQELPPPLPHPLRGVGPHSRLYEELDKLNTRRDGMTPDQLWGEYREIFNRFLTITPTPGAAMGTTKTTTTTDDGEGDDGSFHLREEILDLLPRTYREKARKLYNHVAKALARDSDWRIEKSGAVHYKNKSLNANIIDFLAYAVGRSKTPPNNFNEFEKWLKSSGIPSILLRRQLHRGGATAARAGKATEDEDDDLTAPLRN